MKVSVTKVYRFEASHSLPGHKGKCRRLHGHSYLLEVTVSGPLQVGGSSDGMVIDFDDLSQIVKREVVDQWDHHNLNRIVPFRTTAENLAVEIYCRLTEAGLPITTVRLWETDTGCAEVRNDET